MYPLGGYLVFNSTDGGGTLNYPPSIVPVTFLNGSPTSPVSYFDKEQLINGSAYTYEIQAFDDPPNLPVPLSQAATLFYVHKTSYNQATAYPISTNTALDRNAIRPYGTPGEQLVNIRFVLTQPGNVTIKVYTLSGIFVKQLINQYYGQPGIYWTKWNAQNMYNNLVASGVYLITTESPGGHQEFEKVAVIK